MTDTATNNLSREKLQQLLLLTAAGSSKPDDLAEIEAPEYNWNQPHCFSTTQLKKLGDFIERTASAIARQFSAMCRADFKVTIDPTTQLFADEFFKQVSTAGQKDYYLVFGIDRDHPCGLIGIPLKTAITWATQLLGDTESEEESDRELSQLEESLLMDITVVIINAFSESHGSYKFQPAQAFVKEQLPFEPQDTEPLCRFDFTVAKPDSESSSGAYLLICCDKLEPVVGKRIQTEDKFSVEETSKAIIEHLYQTEVCVTAQLGSAVLSFEQIMNLQTGDILLLGRKIDEPVELIVEGRTLLRGRPAKSAGKQAIVITELSSETE